MNHGKINLYQYTNQMVDKFKIRVVLTESLGQLSGLSDSLCHTSYGQVLLVYLDDELRLGFCGGHGPLLRGS